MVNKFDQFSNILNGDSATMILESHSGLSARIAEQAGFPAIWASGLSISAALGLRDCNEASWSQILDVTECINDAVDVPILFDGDSGFGNYNNVRHIVKKLSNYGIAGVSIEDKVFPKMNSFISGEHGLVSIDEFQGKIKAAQDAKTNDNFCVIARTEALIAGLPVSTALQRAEKYRTAGADAIFIHSKKSSGNEILEFAKHWDKRCPLVVAPTTYSHIPAQVLGDAGITVYIAANHLIRASMKAMQAIASHIKRQRTIDNLDHSISSVSELFTVLDYGELKEAEIRYTQPAPEKPTKSFESVDKLIEQLQT